MFENSLPKSGSKSQIFHLNVIYSIETFFVVQYTFHSFHENIRTRGKNITMRKAKIGYTHYLLSTYSDIWITRHRYSDTNNVKSITHQHCNIYDKI
jgi:hypothetical protein